MIDPSMVPGYDIETVHGEHLGSNDDSTVLPLPGDQARLRYKGESTLRTYEVVRRQFTGSEIVVVVREPREPA